ncbi:MAG: glycine dehydrogenase (aminomethyl-transferring), partial [Saprospiraceae bacterium]|nr:glycine dehydrogenase (aminomethyl-transferring) [Saprospiraceae bacterium]
MDNLAFFDQFVNRHNGPNAEERAEMLHKIGVKNLDQLIDETVPNSIRMERALNVPDALSEYAYLKDVKETASMNKVFKTYIGMGYYDTITPSVIKRNIFENPGWYTQYTPYQAEIAQGRLEALLNFQTMVSDLTGLPIANASLLDEATAAAEAMSMFFALKNKRNKKDLVSRFLVSDKVFPQTIDVLLTRAEPLGIEVVVAPVSSFQLDDQVFGVLLQYPAGDGAVEDYRSLATQANANDIYVTVVADIMSLTLLIPPGEWGADAVVGNTQRFGVPMGFGGPHAAFFAFGEKFKRSAPGRIIGVSIDSQGRTALRMAMQTREQHIRREKANSNICTSQVLLALISVFYAIYHGPKGLQRIAHRIHRLTGILATCLQEKGVQLINTSYFDTLTFRASGNAETIYQRALSQGINLRRQG